MPKVALTFDDGPGPATESLLDLFATRTTAVRMAQGRHRLGNHVYSHARPEAIDAVTLVAEVERTDALLRSIYTDAGLSVVEPFPHQGDIIP